MVVMMMMVADDERPPTQMRVRILVRDRVRSTPCNYAARIQVSAPSRRFAWQEILHFPLVSKEEGKRIETTSMLICCTVHGYACVCYNKNIMIAQKFAGRKKCCT